MDLHVKYAGANPLETGQEPAQVHLVLAQALIPLGLLLVFASAAGALLAPLGMRWGSWNIQQAFALLRWSACGGMAAAVLLAAGVAFGDRVRWFALPAIVVGLTVAGIPWGWQHKLNKLPAIHDISTDTRNVPRFRLIAPLRKRAPNSIEYGGPRIAAMQAKAYPDIRPLDLSVPPSKAFERALAAAQGLGWMVVDGNADMLRIEATASTCWFGFKDDIVVRITAAGRGSRVDVRSVSRVGSGDGGTNAERIRSFLGNIARLSS